MTTGADMTVHCDLCSEECWVRSPALLLHSVDTVTSRERDPGQSDVTPQAVTAEREHRLNTPLHLHWPAIQSIVLLFSLCFVNNFVGFQGKTKRLIELLFPAVTKAV